MPEISPPNLSRGNSQLFRWLALTAVAAGFAGLFFFDPVRYDFYPTCVFHKLTGWNCPGCGATRAAYALLHGRFVEAFHDNLLLVVSLPLLAVYFLKSYFWKRGPSAARLSNRPRLWPWVVFGVLVIFGILRNLPYPAFRWLSPQPM